MFTLWFVSSGARQPEVTQSPIYQKAWFLTMVALVAYVVLISALAMLFISYYKGKGKKYEGNTARNKCSVIKRYEQHTCGEKTKYCNVTYANVMYCNVTYDDVTYDNVTCGNLTY